MAQIPFGELLAQKEELESLKETVGVDKLEENNKEMDDNNNNEMHNNKEIDKSGSPSPLSLAFSLVSYRWWRSITRKSTLV